MRSVSIALLQAIDQRLCALVHMTKTAYIGVSYEDLFANYTNCYKIEPDPGDSLVHYEAKFKCHDGIICCKDDVCVLAVQDANGQYHVYTCTSSSSRVQAFVQAFTTNYEDSDGGTVSVSADGAISIGGCSIKF